MTWGDIDAFCAFDFLEFPSTLGNSFSLALVSIKLSLNEISIAQFDLFSFVRFKIRRPMLKIRGRQKYI